MRSLSRSSFSPVSSFSFLLSFLLVFFAPVSLSAFLFSVFHSFSLLFRFVSFFSFSLIHLSPKPPSLLFRYFFSSCTFFAFLSRLSWVAFCFSGRRRLPPFVIFSACHRLFLLSFA